MPTPAIHLANTWPRNSEPGMSAAELACKIDAPTNRISSILNGRRSITGDNALSLAHFFGTAPEFWLNLQSLYVMRLAEKKAGRSMQVLPRLAQQRSRS